MPDGTDSIFSSHSTPLEAAIYFLAAGDTYSLSLALNLQSKATS
jgi:hypothetical protein